MPVLPPLLRTIISAEPCYTGDTHPSPVSLFLITLQKFQEFWTVSNHLEIAKNRLEKGPDGFF
jgi:hypothetical protein